MGPNIAIFDLKYGVNGKTVTCLPSGAVANYRHFVSNDVRLRGGRVEACLFGRKIGIFWTAACGFA